MTTVTREFLERCLGHAKTRLNPDVENYQQHKEQRALDARVYELALRGLEAEEGESNFTDEVAVARMQQQATELADLRAQVADYEEAMQSKRDLTRQLDVIMNGAEGAAKQASLCDIVSQLGKILPELRSQVASKDEEIRQMKLSHSDSCEAVRKHYEDKVLALRAGLEECVPYIQERPSGKDFSDLGILLRARTALDNTTPSATAVRERIEREAWNEAVEKLLERLRGTYKGLEPLEPYGDGYKRGIRDAITAAEQIKTGDGTGPFPPF